MILVFWFLFDLLLLSSSLSIFNASEVKTVSFPASHVRQTEVYLKGKFLHCAI